MRKNVAGQRVTFSLFKSGARIANPTRAAGDFKVSLDGAAQNNVATLPTTDGAGWVTWLPSQAETNADVVTFLANDAAGDEWEPLTISFDTASAWTEATRTLTSPAATVPTSAATNLLLYCYANNSATISGLTISAARTALYLTIKQALDDADSAATVQITEAAGMTILNGAAAGDPLWGSITPNVGAGTVVLSILDHAAALLAVGDYWWDLKEVIAAGAEVPLASGRCTVTPVVTRAGV